MFSLALILIGLLSGSHVATRVLPPAVRSELTRLYPGWRFATLVPSLRPVIDNEHSPEWIRGDFDGDGRRDYAVQIVRQSPRDSAQLILAVLRRGDGYRLYVVNAGGKHNGIYLVLSRRGERVHDIEADPSGFASITLRTDAITIAYGEEAAETCFYERRRFRCIISGD
jgi:hypothetical protein